MRREQSTAVMASTTNQRGFGSRWVARCLGAALGGMVLCAPLAAHAVEGDLGVSVGGMVAGTVPRLAISPHGGAAIRIGDHFRVGARDMLSILPAIDSHGPGVYNELSPTIEFTWQMGDVSLGPSLGIFSMPACGTIRCTRLNGVVPSQGGYGDVPPEPQKTGDTSTEGSADQSPCDADETPTELVDVRCPKAKRGVECMMYCADNGHFCPTGMPHKVTKELGLLYRCCGCSGDEQCWYAYSNDGVCVLRPELPPGKNLMCL